MSILKNILLCILIAYIVCRSLSLYPTDILPSRKIDFQITNVEGFDQILMGDNFIYTDKGVFINRDSLLRLKFNSQDVLNYLFKKHSDGSLMKCNALISGYRSYWPMTFLPNILEIQCD